MIPYLPHTEAERDRMLQAIKVASVDELFDDIPQDVRADAALFVQKGLSEAETLSHVVELAKLNRALIPFLGMGSYDRIIPAAVASLSSLPAFVTAYTPYQPEISQGLLQAIFEYQTMMCELTGMDVSNASLYDGWSAAAEAASMMLASKRKSSTVLVSDTVHPFMIEVLQTWAKGTDVLIRIIKTTGGSFTITSLEGTLQDSVAGLIVQNPNRYGIVEDYSSLSELLHQNGCQLAISSDPVSLALYKSQAEWGADIAFGDTQPLGLPISFGGPSCGYLAVRKEMMRKMPGRIVGQSVDNRGNRAFVLTLQAREQHIKRERATSNICSNQALAALTTTIHLSLIGWEGLAEAARQSIAKAKYLADALTSIGGMELAWKQPYWCEFTLRFSSRELMERMLDNLKQSGILGGVRLACLTGNPDDNNLLVVAVTEKRSKAELDAYIEIARRSAL
ncbi:MAG: aminomethyl-transferring glycine dehydrogenase subunit GcvPA [Sphaerochaetaceae bacterium]|jgi:glycine dehydrogenase subunit 1|nr:aminomethyl-transferring glycine dehydrogenase subunit GcvPA [Sphaerochaetaceae bacterium]MDX9808771.1 aminomethyl-transferring glycine dehydrogenase subunit GcvPA [Sphaerochaetaceae bacterium]NLV83181.1 aminomethyl-transferring glycine dehydrogenase subunit GcvPA [Spirochaetales bacterium]